MEHFLPEALNLWLTQYGSFALFMLLALGIFALPLPDETLMLFAGALMAKSQLEILPTIIACIAGALCGITLSYVIGRTAGIWLIRRYGHWIRLTEAKMQRVHEWFEKIGCWTLLVGYFIPGIRHLTGYAAGITELEYRKFALFAYTGGILWASVFLSLGYFVGHKWVHIVEMLDQAGFKVLFIILGLAALAGIYIWWHVRRRRINNRNMQDLA